MSDDSSSTVVEVEMRDLQDRREELLNAARRHTLWAVLGLSPGAIIPLVVSVGEMGMGVFVAALVAMTGTETVRAVRARLEADAIGTAVSRRYRSARSWDTVSQVVQEGDS